MARINRLKTEKSKTNKKDKKTSWLHKILKERVHREDEKFLIMFAKQIGFLLVLEEMPSYAYWKYFIDIRIPFISITIYFIRRDRKIKSN